MKQLAHLIASLIFTFAVFLDSAKAMQCTAILDSRTNWASAAPELSRLNNVLHFESLNMSDQGGLLIKKPFEHYSAFSDQMIINLINELSESLAGKQRSHIHLFEIYILSSELFARLGIQTEVRRINSEAGLELFIVGTKDPKTKLNKVIQKIKKLYSAEVGSPKSMILNRSAGGQASKNSVKISLFELIRERRNLTDGLNGILLHEIEHVAHLNSEKMAFLTELKIYPSKDLRSELMASYKSSFPADELEAFLGEFFRMRHNTEKRYEAYTVAKQSLGFYMVLSETLNQLERDITSPGVERNFQIYPNTAGYFSTDSGGLTMKLEAQHQDLSSIELVGYFDMHIQKLKHHLERRLQTAEMLRAFVLEYENQQPTQEQ